MTAYKEYKLPTGETRFIPNDILLTIRPNLLPVDQKHFLVEIPWSDKYLSYVPKKYLAFFTSAVLPLLHARTTDVHTAICMEFVDELIKAVNKPVDEAIVNLGLMLHDNGWSKLSEQEIACSLGYTGLELSDISKDSKEKHAVVGSEIAREVLNKHKDNLFLSTEQIDLICKAIRWHDKPEELAENGDIPLEIQLICDLDHLWSFTHENFWQDTARKNVDPQTYLDNIRNYIDKYFLTDAGKRKAMELSDEREKEVEQLK